MQEANGVLEFRPTTRPADMQKKVRENIQRAQKKLTSVRKLLGDGQGEWGRAFSASAEELARGLGSYRKAWQKASLPGDWRKLKLAAEKVQDALIDLGVLAAREPLVVALRHARDAKELSGDDGRFRQQPWVRQLIREAEDHGKELIEQDKWNEALSVYGSGGLSSLDEDSITYKDALKRVVRHVHAISLYGRKAPAAGASTQPGGGDGQDPATRPADEPRWVEMLVGIDTAMIRNAISLIGDSYVDRPDYRKLGIAALEGVKILVESPQAAEALPGLSQKQKRSKFVSGLDGQTDRLRNAATVDHLDVTQALNALHDLNDDTLALPSEVLDMEFAEAMLAALDRFTSMIWPYEAQDFNKRTMGSFFGIGVQIRKRVGEAIEVVTPLADTPAFHAGIRAGDYIEKVDGRATRTISLERAVKRITGPQHTKVTLTIRRAGVSKPFAVVIVRDRIHIQTVKGWRRLPNGKWGYFLDSDRGIGYVRVTQFTRDTATEIRLALQAAKAAGARGVIVDMRFNPGGLLTAAVEVADEFLHRGLIVRTKGRNVPESEKLATAVGEYQRGEVVVLVNQFSASAAEIAAGAMKDWGRATLVGMRTFGKGSVQRLIPLQLKRPAKLKLTTAYYYLPSGRCLHRTNSAKFWGVDPHISVPVTVRQMNRWAEIRQETDLLKEVDPKLLDDLLAQQLQEDLQLRTALLLLRLKLLARET